jgi:hypothetical protein
VFVGGARVATCFDFDFPDRTEPANSDKVCFGPEIDSALHLSGITQDVKHHGSYRLSGETSARVANVSVTYERADGERVFASGSYGRITKRIAKVTGIKYRAGELCAFLPGSAIDNHPDPSDPHSLAPTIRVTAYDADGKVLDSDRWGDR